MTWVAMCAKNNAAGAGKVLKFSLAALAATLASAGVLAQAPSPAKPASAATGDLPMLSAPSEAVQRQALGPYRMILQNANQAKAKPAAPAVVATPAPVAAQAPKRAVAVAPATPAAPPAAATAATPTKAPETTTSSAAPVPPPTPVTAKAEPTPAPAAATQVAAIAPGAAVVAAPAQTAPAAQPVAVARKELIAIRQDAPVLANALLAEISHGLVKVRFDVNPDGSTSAVQVAASSNRKLNNAAMAAVSKWRFQPIEATRSAEIEISFSND